MTDTDKLDYPATHRNRDAITEVLRGVLDDMAEPAPHILEIASGSGQHASAIAPALRVNFPGLIWQASDPDPACRASIDAWAQSESTPAPAALEIDTTNSSHLERVPAQSVDLLICINMIHIAPWSAAVGLMQLAARALKSNGHLYLYGPYMLDGRHHAASNAAFSESLQQRNPAWGVRDLAEVEALAHSQGLQRARLQAMPANNHSVVFRRSPPGLAT